MTATFFTSREQATAWFTLETRPLRMPDGTTKLHTDCRLTWRAYDYIVEQGLYTGPQLVGLVVLSMNEGGGSFESNFANVLAYIQDEYLQSLDRD